MTKTQYFVAASVDGYIADAAGRIDWLLAFDGTPGLAEHYNAFLAEVGALAMGARTYEFLLSHPGPWPYADLPTWVFTHRALPVISGANIRFCSAHPRDVHAAMLAAASGKNLWLIGGGALAEQFQAEQLIDELWLTVVPLVLGSGAPLLGAAAVPALELCGVKPFERGLVELRYRFARALTAAQPPAAGPREGHR